MLKRNKITAPFDPIRRKIEKAYLEKVGYVCANPDCESGYDIEAHHIIPFRNGEQFDRLWNLVPLCRACHRRGGFHRRNFNAEVKLFTWKCMREMKVLGYVLDEEQDKWARIHHREDYHKDGSECGVKCIEAMLANQTLPASDGSKSDKS